MAATVVEVDDVVVLALVGLVERSPIWTWVLVWATLWALQLSILNVGQRWYGFGWEILLAEAGFLAIFVGPAHVAPPLVKVARALGWQPLPLTVNEGKAFAAQVAPLPPLPSATWRASS